MAYITDTNNTVGQPKVTRAYLAVPTAESTGGAAPPTTGQLWPRPN